MSSSSPALSFPLYAALRFSRVTPSKASGYHRLPDVKQICIDEACYEVRTSRGSGPGGQGANSSSNKVELRVDLELLALSLMEGGVEDGAVKDVVEGIRRNERLAERHEEGSAGVLIVSSHEHRSALQNKEACLAKVRQIVKRASWVPPAPADPIQTPSRTITQRKLERRRKGRAIRMTRAARQGLW